MTRMQKLQKQYNELHERLGYLRDPYHIEACNNALDRINEEMEEILNRRKDA